MQTTELIGLAAHCRDYLLLEGVSVREVSNTPEVLEVLNSFGKRDIHPKHDPLKNDFGLDDSFWLIVSRDGKDFGAVCARFENLGDEPLGDYLTRTTKRHYPEAGAATFSHVTDPRINEVRGRCAYMGDLYFAKWARGQDWTADVLSFLLMLNHLTIVLKWNTDCTYAFLREIDILRNKMKKYHFPSEIEDYQRWENPPPGRSETESLLYITKASLFHKVAALNRRPTDLQWSERMERNGLLPKPAMSKAS